MKRLGVLALLVASAALAKPRPAGAVWDMLCLDNNPSCLVRRAEAMGKGLKLLEPGSVAVSPLLCTAASQLGLLTGNFACLNGDGTQDSSAGYALSAVGSPTTQVLETSPNGNNSAAVVRKRLDGSTQDFETTALAPPSGDFSACFLGIEDAPLATEDLVSQDGNGGRNFKFQINANGSVAFCTNGAVTCATSGTGLVTGGAEAFDCFAFKANGATSTATVYVAGVQAGQSTTMGAPVAGAQSIGIGHGTTYLRGGVRGAFFTSKALTQTDVQRLYAALIPAPQTAAGVAISNSRNSASWVTTSDGTLVALPPGRTGVVGPPGETGVVGGIVSSPARTTINLYSEQFDQAAWTKNGSGTGVTANAAVAPDGSMTADLFKPGGGLDASHAYLSQSFATTGTHTVSIFAASAGLQYAVLDFGLYANGDYAIVDLTSGAVTRAPSGGGSVIVKAARFGYWRIAVTSAQTNQNVAVSATSSPTSITLAMDGTQGVYFWGFMNEASSIASPYCRSESTSATCSGDVVTVPTPSWLSTKEGCAAYSITPAWTGSAPGSAYFLMGNSALTARLAYSAAGSNVTAYDGTHVAGASGSFSAGVRSRYVTRWSASGNYLRVDNLTTGVQGTPTAFSGFPSFDSTIQIGGIGGSGQPFGSIIDSVTLGSSSGGCN